MPDPTTTIRGAGPGPVRLGAIEVARSKIGEREIAKNQGPIVDWSLQGLTSHPAAGDAAHAAGWALWCAYFASQCFRRELIRRADELLLAEWTRAHLASGSCDSLWAHLDGRGWAWRRGAALPAALCAPGAADPGLPAAGDFLFYGVEGNLAHVGLIEIVDGAGRIGSIEGNAGDRVAAVEHPGDHPRIYGFARVPW